MIHARILISLYLLNPMFNRVMIIVAIKITLWSRVRIAGGCDAFREFLHVSTSFSSRMKGLCMIALLLFAAVLDAEGNLVPTHFRFIN